MRENVAPFSDRPRQAASLRCFDLAPAQDLSLRTPRPHPPACQHQNTAPPRKQDSAKKIAGTVQCRGGRYKLYKSNDHVTVFACRHFHLPKAMGKKGDGPIQAAITWEERYAAWKEFWDFEKWGFNKDRKCGSSLFSLLPFSSVNGRERWVSIQEHSFF
jgi:hypothetical protein